MYVSESLVITQILWYSIVKWIYMAHEYDVCDESKQNFCFEFFNRWKMSSTWRAFVRTIGQFRFLYVNRKVENIQNVEEASKMRVML